VLQGKEVHYKTW